MDVFRDEPEGGGRASSRESVNGTIALLVEELAVVKVVCTLDVGL